MSAHFKTRLLLLFCLFGYTLQAQENMFKDTAIVGIRPSAEKPVSRYYRNIEMTSLYKELNHFSLFAPFGELFAGKRYVFSADINPLYIFSNSIRSRWNFGIGAHIMARMFQDSSFPIRTPSFIPTVKLYFRVSNEQAHYKFLGFSFTHHSNGQDAPSKVNGNWNDKNGNFSTNFVTLAYEWGKNEGNVRNHFAAYFIQHISIGNVLSQDDSLKGYYGQTRAGIDFQRRHIQHVSFVNKATGEPYFSYNKERARIHFYVNFIARGLDKLPSYSLERRINTEIKYHYFLKSLREGGFFGGIGYYGEDPYNIFFHNHYFFVRLGLSAGTAFFKANQH